MGYVVTASRGTKGMSHLSKRLMCLSMWKDLVILYKCEVHVCACDKVQSRRICHDHINECFSQLQEKGSQVLSSSGKIIRPSIQSKSI